MSTQTAKDVWTCPQCGKEFGSQHALGGHISAAHRTSPPPGARAHREGTAEQRDFSFKARMAALQRDAAEPFRVELAEVEDQLKKLNRERDELLQMRGQLQAVLRKLDPTATPRKNAGGGNEARVQREHAERVTALRDYITEHADELQDGFTMNSVVAQLKESGGKAMTVATARAAIEQLRDEGLIRADKMVRGGGMNWKLTTNGATDGDA